MSLVEQKKRGVAIYVRQNIEAQMVYTDKEVRVLMVEVRLAQKKILLVNIYAPNCNQGAFFQGLHKVIVELEYEHICIIGDFNAIVDANKDYTPGERSFKGVKRTLPKVWDRTREELGIGDTWRELHPEERQYTYFSPRQRTWTRIDMIWVTPELKEMVREIEIAANEWADHNPLVLIWKGGKVRQRWTMRAALMVSGVAYNYCGKIGICPGVEK